MKFDLINQKICADFNTVPRTAAEYEFYIRTKSGDMLDDTTQTNFLAALFFGMRDKKIPVYGIGNEDGDGQYEVATHISSAPHTIEHIYAIKELIEVTSNKFNAVAYFDALPFEDQPPCSMQLHIHLENEYGNNLFMKRHEQESLILLYAVGGLLDILPDATLLCAPNEASYKRFGKSPFSPSHIAWGGNNRSCVVRIPTSTINPASRHIEFRLAGSDAVPEDVMSVLLYGVYNGLKNKINPPEKLWGNAYDSQYALPLLPSNLSEAKFLFKNSTKLNLL